jgi:3-oxoacyl-[acyl-carrier protein] reductase
VNLDNLQLRGRVAIVTGGSRGIGRAIVELLAQLGAHVVVNYLKGEKAAEATVSAARAKGVQAVSCQADVSNPLEAQRLIDTTVKQFERIDILVCNAGIWGSSGRSIDGGSLESNY